MHAGGPRFNAQNSREKERLPNVVLNPSSYSILALRRLKQGDRHEFRALELQSEALSHKVKIQNKREREKRDGREEGSRLRKEFSSVPGWGCIGARPQGSHFLQIFPPEAGNVVPWETPK